MSEIGKPLKRYDSQSQNNHWFLWFCASLLMIGFGFMTYCCWIEQSVMMAGRYGQPNYRLDGLSAITAGYGWFAMFMASVSMGFMESPNKRVIDVILFIIWLIVSIWVHFNLAT